MLVKLQTETTFDFDKLHKSIKNIINKFQEETINKESEAMQSRLQKGQTINGKMDGLSDVAKVTRILRGHSPTSPPLNASGALTRSIKPRKTGISGKEYGIHHNFGFTTKNRPLIPEGNKKPKGGLRKRVFNFKGKKIPARQFMHNDNTFVYDEKIINNLFKAIRKNLKK